MIPVLLKPHLYRWKNTLLFSIKTRRELFRNLVVLFFISLLVLFAFAGTISALNALATQEDKLFIPASLPLCLILFFIFFLLLFSSSISALGNFYLGKDIEFILASPITMRSFFWGRFLQVFCHAGWMACVFAVPMIYAFGSFHSAPFSYYVVATLSLLIFLCIPVSIAIIFITLFASLVPARRSREALLVALLALLFMLILVGEPFSPHSIDDLERTMALFRLFLLPEAQFLPSQWLGFYLHSFLEPTEIQGSIWYLLQTIMTAGAIMTLSYIVVRMLHRYAYSKAQVSTIAGAIQSKGARQRLGWLKELFPPCWRAIFAKELKLFARDTTQTVQLALLLGLCILYVSNFQGLRIGEHLDPGMAMWWEAFLVVSNIFLGGLVLIAVCARFVFPCISLEGPSLWIIQSSPLSLYQVLQAKFWFWFIPLGVISSVIFTSGAMAINVDIHIACIHAMASWILAYGIVGLAIGMGAMFSNFSWENPAQLMSSSGSLLYMISAAFLLLISLLPTTFLIIMRTLRNLGHDFPLFTWYTIVLLCSAALVFLQHAVVRWALKNGEGALSKKVFE